jgi:hypothetical protein
MTSHSSFIACARGPPLPALPPQHTQAFLSSFGARTT